MNKEIIYWMTFAHKLPLWSFSNREGWKNEDKNNLIIKFFHEKKISIEDFFQLSENSWKNDYQLTNKQISDLMQAKSALPNNAFWAETLLNNGIEVIPVISPYYSKTLKVNLKKSAPSVIYIKGNKQIMAEKSIAIVGSREASDLALQFTNNIAKLASKEHKVVVSGFAKGVDKQALDATLIHKGQSIIVLPQGIMTFGSGFKTYYKQIINGDVLVLSIFPPNMNWDKNLAMARNSIIYGLAEEIYVAQSSEKGGTWAGVKEGLRKKRKIYVRKPDASEKNANSILIEKGAISVDCNGNILESENNPTNLKETDQLSLF
ncbi:MAG: DNA-processing protein DprA [Bacteroidales bacterium]|jgi:DNA protecting protein DprA|nr:DNA-processing protein DprA [Bacteroidales bacterium]